MLREIPAGRPHLAVLEGEEIAVVRIGPEFFAVSNVCAHEHIAALHRGRLDGCTLECPMHGWRYDLRSGLGVTGEGRIRVYATRVIGDELFVNIS